MANGNPSSIHQEPGADHREKRTRVSVSLTRAQYEFLTDHAERKRVSIAWVIRDAIDKLVSEETPLFKRSPS